MVDNNNTCSNKTCSQLNICICDCCLRWSFIKENIALKRNTNIHDIYIVGDLKEKLQLSIAEDDRCKIKNLTMHNLVAFEEDIFFDPIKSFYLYNNRKFEIEIEIRLKWNHICNFNQIRCSGNNKNINGNKNKQILISLSKNSVLKQLSIFKKFANSFANVIRCIYPNIKYSYNSPKNSNLFTLVLYMGEENDKDKNGIEKKTNINDVFIFCNVELSYTIHKSKGLHIYHEIDTREIPKIKFSKLNNVCSNCLCLTCVCEKLKYNIYLEAMRIFTRLYPVNDPINEYAIKYAYSLTSGAQYYKNVQIDVKCSKIITQTKPTMQIRGNFFGFKEKELNMASFDFPIVYNALTNKCFYNSPEACFQVLIGKDTFLPLPFEIDFNCVEKYILNCAIIAPRITHYSKKISSELFLLDYLHKIRRNYFFVLNENRKYIRDEIVAISNNYKDDDELKELLICKSSTVVDLFKSNKNHLLTFDDLKNIDSANIIVIPQRFIITSSTSGLNYLFKKNCLTMSYILENFETNLNTAVISPIKSNNVIDEELLSTDEMSKNIAQILCMLDLEKIEQIKEKEEEEEEEEKKTITNNNQKQKHRCSCCFLLTSKIYLPSCQHCPWCYTCFFRYFIFESKNDQREEEEPNNIYFKCILCRKDAINGLVFTIPSGDFYENNFTNICKTNNCSNTPNSINKISLQFEYCKTCTGNLKLSTETHFFAYVD